MPLHNTIQYYNRQVYGGTNTYITPPSLASKVRLLTGKKTVDSVDLDALGAVLKEITGKQVKFEQVLDPASS
jgi:hypothetical protein